MGSATASSSADHATSRPVVRPAVTEFWLPMVLLLPVMMLVMPGGAVLTLSGGLASVPM